ncbi:MAG: SDR family oxidoreductase [Janthinobacterium lividum]
MEQRVVLITGAAKRVGRTIAERFAIDGYRVVVHYGNSVEEAQETVDALSRRGVAAHALHADLSDAAQLDALVAGAYAHFGRLDVLINSASIFPDDRLEDFSVETFDHAWAVNGRAPLLLTRAFHARASALGHTGVVINVVDQKVRGNFHRDHFSYTVGKAAIGQLTTMLAKSAAPVLRVNAVYPGLMLPSGDQSAADFAYAERHATPLHRVATPWDLADAILLLTGPAYNGADWVVDGGQNLVPVARDVLFEYRSPSA